jgi:hypothetical protein
MKSYFEVAMARGNQLLAQSDFPGCDCRAMSTNCVTALKVMNRSLGH